MGTGAPELIYCTHSHRQPKTKSRERNQVLIQTTIPNLMVKVGLILLKVVVMLMMTIIAIILIIELNWWFCSF
jgi:hypothetical protein